MKSLWIWTIFRAFELCSGAKILASAAVPTISHHILIERLSIELASRGHEVTLITPFKQSQPVKNLKEIIIPNDYEIMQETRRKDRGEDDNFIQRYSIWWILVFFPRMSFYMTNRKLSLPDVQALLKSNEKFDLILGETIGNEAFIAGLSYKYKAPIVAVNNFLASTDANFMVGNPAPSSYIPDTLLDSTNKMTFLERFANTLLIWAKEIIHRLWNLPLQDEIMRKYFGDDLPSIEDIIKNTSLVLVNNHFSLAFPRPYLPNIVEIGGCHVQPTKPLPADLEKYLNESKHGAILFSMGSCLKSTHFFCKDTKQAILKAFSRLKQNILWKFEDESLVNLPKNVKILKWFPQMDILAHPSVKLFITHGGMHSITETVIRGVPIVGIPLIGDQFANLKFAQNAGYGVTLKLHDITEETLYESIMEVLNNPKYRENVRRGSILLQDTPLSALDTAIFWIEYIIRHKGAPHLRSTAQDLKWYQLYLLDVLGLMLIISIAWVLTCFYIARFLVKRLFSLCRKKPFNVLLKEKKIN